MWFKRDEKFNLFTTKAKVFSQPSRHTTLTKRLWLSVRPIIRIPQGRTFDRTRPTPNGCDYVKRSSKTLTNYVFVTFYCCAVVVTVSGNMFRNKKHQGGQFFLKETPVNFPPENRADLIWYLSLNQHWTLERRLELFYLKRVEALCSYRTTNHEH